MMANFFIILLFSAIIYICIGLQNRLLLSNRKDIRLLDYDARRKNSTKVIVNNAEDVNFLDYHLKNQTVYWADVGLEEIRSCQINDPKTEKSIVSMGITSPDGLAVDWLGNKLYWTDSETNRIEVSNLDGSLRRIMFWKDLDQPRAIALLPMDGWIFWTDWGEVPKIEKASMDGDHTTRKIIVSDENNNCASICWPNGLAVSYEKKRLYWTDAKTKTIESVDFDGKFRQRISKDPVPHPFAITVHRDTLYWTDWSTKAIHSCNLQAGCSKRTTFGGYFTPMGIRVYNEDQQPEGEDFILLVFSD